jgi:hypothetical protein
MAHIMANYPASPPAHFSDDTQIWDSLKVAIASTSGFQRWELESKVEDREDSSLDYRVRRYLRETLETLAY